MRHLASFLAFALVSACEVEPDAQAPDADAFPTEDTASGQAPPPAYQLWFSSTRAWPPTLLNNPTVSVPGQYRSPFWGTCPGGALPAVTNRALGNASAYTGLAQPNVQQYTCPEAIDPVLEPPFLQLDDASKTVGIWLNSVKTSGGTLTASTPAYELPVAQRPWTTATSQLSVNFRMKVERFSWHASGTNGPVVPYAMAWVILRLPATGQQIWYGAAMFDPRPCTEWVMLDVGTNMPMVSTCFGPNTTFAHLGAGSATTRSTAGGMQYFDLNVSHDDVLRGIRAYNAWAVNNGFGTLPTDVRSVSSLEVTALALNPEVADHDRDRYDQLALTIANGYADPTPLDIWYQRAGVGGWQYAKQITVPGGGAWMTHMVNLRDVWGFAGEATAFALNPAMPAGGGSFGFDEITLQGGWGVPLRAWHMDNPAPPTWGCDGATCSASFMQSFWTAPSAWGGELVNTPSFQITNVTPAPVDPAGTLGLQFKEIRMAKLR
jgi:hypothetical protein